MKGKQRSIVRRGAFVTVVAWLSASAFVTPGIASEDGAARGDLISAEALLEVDAGADGDSTPGPVPFDDFFADQVRASDTNQNGSTHRANASLETELGFDGNDVTSIHTSATGFAKTTVVPGDSTNDRATGDVDQTVVFDSPGNSSLYVTGIIEIIVEGLVGQCPSFVEIILGGTGVVGGGRRFTAMVQEDCSTPPAPPAPDEISLDEQIELQPGTVQVRTVMRFGAISSIALGAQQSQIGALWDLDFVVGCDNEFDHESNVNDVITGSPGEDTLCGGKGNDTINGRGSDDQIYGGDGDDPRLYGGLGNDRIEGGLGDESSPADPAKGGLVGGGGNDTLVGGDGDDQLVGRCLSLALGGSGFCEPDPLPPADPDRDTLDGGAGADRIEGEGDRDVIEGGTGRDLIDGGAAKDLIDGGPGNEIVQSGSQILAGISGGGGNDDIFGGAGDDLLDGLGGKDHIFGGPGSDKLRGDEDADCLVGDPGGGPVRKDVLVGHDGNDTFLARDGVRDEVRGGPAPDRGRFDRRDDVTSVDNRSFTGPCPEN